MCMHLHAVCMCTQYACACSMHVHLVVMYGVPLMDRTDQVELRMDAVGDWPEEDDGN